MAVRAKFFVRAIEMYSEPRDTGLVKLSAVVTDRSETNKSWSKWTPSGNFELNISNPDAFKQFVLGKSYFIDFTEVPDEPAQ